MFVVVIWLQYDSPTKIGIVALDDPQAADVTSPYVGTYVGSVVASSYPSVLTAATAEQ